MACLKQDASSTEEDRFFPRHQGKRKRPEDLNRGESENNDLVKHGRQDCKHQQAITRPNREQLPASNLKPLRRSQRIRDRQTSSEQTPRKQSPKSTRPQRKQDIGEVSTLFHNGLSPVLTSTASREGQAVDLKENNTKRQLHTTPSIKPDVASTKHSLILEWLANTDWSRQSTSTQSANGSYGLATMPRKPLLSPDNIVAISDSGTQKTKRSTASVHDADYRQALRRRNIYIERQDPQPVFMQQANQIISRPRTSPDIDDAAIQELINKARRLQEETEDELVQQLAPGIITAIPGTSDPRIARSANQLWFNAVPVPLNSTVIVKQLSLPKPMPDLTFGYPETAFRPDQLSTIDLLTDGTYGGSYAKPNKTIYFPFFTVEFKSQATTGTHYVATNQVAGAGAIAMHGDFELTTRAFGEDFYNYTEPMFFSLTMDYDFARINVHWLKAASPKEQRSFHVERLSQYFLNDAVAIRNLTRAINNILDHGSNTRLPILCQAMDAYREKVVREREAEATNAENTSTAG